MRYHVKFPVGHDWGSKGGKLPGMFAGMEGSESGFSHGNGWSTRYMWRNSSANSEVYYYTGCSGGAGIDLPMSFNWQADGKWHSIEQAVDRKAGTVQAWYDGNQVLAPTSLGCDISVLPFGGVFFSTFYGGHDTTWGPSVDSSAEFADFEVSTTYIGP